MQESPYIIIRLFFQAVVVFPRGEVEGSQSPPVSLAQPRTSQLQGPCHEYSPKLESPCFEREVVADGYEVASCRQLRLFSIDAALLSDISVQVRKYASTAWAVTDVAADDWNAAINTGFRNLFQYISGFNEGHQIIPMAVPGMVVSL